MRTAALVLVALLPWPLKRPIYRWLFRWTIEPGARVGLCVITAGHVHLGRQSRIGHFNVVRNVPRLVLGHHAAIGQWNWITCGEHFVGGRAAVPPPKEQGLFMAPYAALTSRHYVDCPGGVSIGDYAVVAGVRSSLITHEVDFDTSTMVCRPIRIGKYSYVGSNVKITPGSSVPDFCVVGMGAVVAGELTEEHTLYAGVPAKPIRTVEHGSFFRRENPRGL
ncbi:MAG: acyltransferase [Thermomicrobiales bacterium]